MSQSDPNLHTIDAVISSIQSSIYSTSATGQYGSADPRTELDSNANVVVLGKHLFIFESSGKTCNVSPFAKELGIASNVPIVDGAIAYNCPTTKETYILIVRNALYMLSMDLNLIPPFIMRASGVQVNGVPKIHCDDLTTNDHFISFKDIDLWIPLQLFGTFSYFHTTSQCLKKFMIKTRSSSLLMCLIGIPTVNPSKEMNVLCSIMKGGDE